MQNRADQSGFTLLELMLSLVIASIASLAAIQIMLNNEYAFVQVRERSELLASALASSEMLRQASWIAGHSTIDETSDIASAITITGSAPQSHLHVTYALDAVGLFVNSNCVGNRRSQGRAIRQTTDDWHARQVDGSISLFCRPRANAGAELTERINGMDFSLLLQDQSQRSSSTTRLIRQRNMVDGLYIHAVIAEVTARANDNFSQLMVIDPVFGWQTFQPSRANDSIAWQLTLPVAIDIP